MLRPLAYLTLALPLLTACTGEAGTTKVEVDPSPFLAAFDATSMREARGQAFSETVTHWSRSGVSVSPPGHHFTHWSVTGTIAEADLTALQASLLEEMAAALETAGLTCGEWTDAAGRDDAIVRQILGPGMEDVTGSTARYEHGGGEGWVEVLTARNPREPGTVTIGCGLHEPTHR